MPMLEQAADAAVAVTPYCRVTVTTSNGELLQIPTEMLGKFCIFIAESVDVWVRFGATNGVQVDQTQTSTVSSNTITVAGAKVPHLYIPAGSFISRRIRTQFLWMAHVSTATTGKFRFGLDTGNFGAATD